MITIFIDDNKFLDENFLLMTTNIFY